MTFYSGDERGKTKDDCLRHFFNFFFIIDSVTSIPTYMFSVRVHADNFIAFLQQKLYVATDTTLVTIKC